MNFVESKKMHHLVNNSIPNLIHPLWSAGWLLLHWQIVRIVIIFSHDCAGGLVQKRLVKTKKVCFIYCLQVVETRLPKSKIPNHGNFPYHLCARMAFRPRICAICE